jgi:hypothetical protein
VSYSSWVVTVNPLMFFVQIEPVGVSRSLDPHGLDRSNEPDAIVLRGVLNVGRGSAL